MSTQVSLPENLRVYVEERVAATGYRSADDYVQELIRRDQALETLRHRIDDGLGSPRAEVADADYFRGLRERARRRAA